MLGINIQDWVTIFREVVWDYKTIATNIPWYVWLSIILAVGVNLFARNYLKNVNPSEYPEELTSLVKVKNVL